MIRQRDLINVHLGVVGLFSIGYYPLPVLLKPLSTLVEFPEDQVAHAIFMHWLFLLCLIFGATLAKRHCGIIKPLRFGFIDTIFSGYQKYIVLLCFILYMIYYSTNDLTSYASDNLEAYYEDRPAFVAIVATLSDLALATITLFYAHASFRKQRLFAFVLATMITVIVLLSALLGQRLALILPLCMVFIALFLTRQSLKAIRTLGLTVVVLAVASPFAVFLRENRGSSGERQSATAVASNYSFSETSFQSSLQSLVDRSDLIYVTVAMKPYLDTMDDIGWKYYFSVLAIPIPRVIYPNKPYVLSSNGDPGGEMSVLAWQTLIGGRGSLTAFGGLVAYREGGWVGVILNGLATGILFIFLARWLGQGSLVARVFYINLFVQLAVRKVPPSFFEALASLLTFAPLLACLFLISKLVPSNSKSHASALTHS
jgi:oligosaccharide repeat unit polymerase